MFALEKALDTLNEVKDGSPEEVINHIKEAVGHFVGEAVQFDTI